MELAVRAIPLSSSRWNKKKPLYANSMSGCVHYRLCIARASFSYFFLLFFLSFRSSALGSSSSSRVDGSQRFFFSLKFALGMLFGKQKMLQLIYALNWKKRERKVNLEKISESL